MADDRGHALFNPRDRPGIDSDETNRLITREIGPGRLSVEASKPIPPNKGAGETLKGGARHERGGDGDALRGRGTSEWVQELMPHDRERRPRLSWKERGVRRYHRGRVVSTCSSARESLVPRTNLRAFLVCVRARARVSAYVLACWKATFRVFGTLRAAAITRQRRYVINRQRRYGNKQMGINRQRRYGHKPTAALWS